MITANSSYLGCAEPSWAAAVPEPQLRGLLTLASLMSENVYLSDVHVGDNKNFLTSFRRKKPLGLYAQLRQLTDHGVVKYLLRDASVRPQVGSSLAVNSFVDVYTNWLRQDDNNAWIMPPDGKDRSAFLGDLDSWVPEDSVERYDYLATKTIFIEAVRAVGSSPMGVSWIGFDNTESSKLLRRGYDAILDRDWFSLSDFYTLFQKAGFAANTTPMLLHGLLNEISYSQSRGSSLVGADLHGVPLEDVFWPGGSPASAEPSKPRTVTPVEAILERAHKVLEAPDLAVVALLSADEVMALRESSGRSYFDLLNLAVDENYVVGQNDFGRRLADVAADYWQGVAEHLAQFHPGATHRPRKLAILLGQLPGGVGRQSRKLFSFAVNVGLPAASALGAPGVGVAATLAQKASSDHSLRFLFVAEAEELRRIRQVVPNRTWLTKSNAIVLPYDARE